MEKRSQERDGPRPSIEMEEKMSHYSQHCPSKDFDKMKPIIIIIDCFGTVCTAGGYSSLSLYTQICIKDRSVYQLLPLQIHIQPLEEVA